MKKLKNKEKMYIYFAYLTGAGSTLSFFEPKISDSICFFLLAADCSNSVPKMLLL